MSSGFDSSLISAIVLAAGKGTRMKSDVPKVLHTIHGKYMVQWVLDMLKSAGVTNVCLVANRMLLKYSDVFDKNPNLSVCVQINQLGTADAVASAACAYSGVTQPYYSQGDLIKGGQLSSKYVLICTGDTPALNSDTIKDFIDACLNSRKKIGILGMDHPNPTGYGRLVCDENNTLIKVVEDQDANDDIKKITICNSGVMLAETKFLFDLLNLVKPINVKKEYYLTDCFELATKYNEGAYVFVTKSHEEFSGVNTPEQLSKMQELLSGRA